MNSKRYKEYLGLIPAVGFANDLTERWCTRCGEGDFAISGAGLWPLLALLGSATDEQARAELEQALGALWPNRAGWPPFGVDQYALTLVDILRADESTTAALGVLTHEGIPLRDGWASQLPRDLIGTLANQAALDKWVAEGTDGLIAQFPLQLKPETLLVLASALAMRVKWDKPFDSLPRSGDHGEPGQPNQQWLSRTTDNLTCAAVINDAVTVVVVEGDGDVDVYLLLGDLEPGEVLATGLRLVANEPLAVHTLDIFDLEGPGLTVERVTSGSPNDVLRVELPSFEISCRHNLLEQADFFGLRSLTEPGIPHLPLLSPVPLSVSEGVQDVLVRFSAEGFGAAATTAIETAVGGPPPENRYEVKHVRVTFDRPFGFLAVHRPTGLAVVAGWVSSPFGGEGS